MKFSGFQSHVFQRQVNNALESVRRILDNNREPKLAEEVQDHEYDDKYALAEFLTNTAIAAQWNILERMGVTTTDMMETLQEHVRDKQSLTLRFEATDTCEFLKEAKVDVVTFEEQVETETSQTGSILSRTRKESSKYKVVTKVTEYHWNVGMDYKLSIYAGSDPKKNPLILQTRSSSTVISTTGSKTTSIVPKKTSHNPIEVDITWLVEQTMSKEDGHKKKGEEEASRGTTTCSFRINRTTQDCKTPVRNDDIQRALHFFLSFKTFSRSCIHHFKDRVERRILGRHCPANHEKTPKNVSLSSIDAAELFCPVVPLLEETANREVAGTSTRQEAPKSLLVLPSLSGSANGSGSSSPLLSLGDIDKFLNEQIRSFGDAQACLSQTFPSSDQAKLITTKEASLILLLHGSKALCSHYWNSVYYIEEMLRKQLVAAIGKAVQPDDFDQYMSHHMSKLFGPDYRPTPFCYAIRRPNQYPDGILSIEQQQQHNNSATSSSNGTATTPPPIHTIVRHMEGATSSESLEIPINAATKVMVTGDRYLHGWIRHRFESSSSGGSMFHVAARARQFSSFLLMVGVMGGANEFHPKNAIILQNKDEVLIPLLLNELPTAKDFRDAISSLSPEQQRFAKSFRSMQLESSVFGICIVQLKPQLEALLNLPPGALNKEIRLTQDLMSLFVDYQVPSDLLSFEGNESVTIAEKVATVKGHVAAVLEVIDDSKKSQMKEAEQAAVMSEQKFISSAFDVEHEEDVARQLTARSLKRVPRRLSKSDKLQYCESYNRRAKARPKPPPSSLSEDFRVLRIGGLAGAKEDLVSNEEQAQAPAPAKKIAVVAAPTSTPDDCTMLPKVLDSMFEKHDTNNSLRTTILDTKLPWSRNRQENLLSKMKTKKLEEGDVKMEKNKAFDLLDALSRSGSLEISCAELHVVIAVTHCFENDVMGTVIQDNVNPIEKVERSALMVAGTIHGVNAVDMIKDESDKGRLARLFPGLVVQPVDLLTE